MTSHDNLRVFPDYPNFSPSDIEYEVSSTRKRLPIPDLRFEQVYLGRIQDCIHTGPAEGDVKEKGSDQHAIVNTQDTELVASTRVIPLIDPWQQVVRVDWGKLVYITLRDQVMMPLLQGMVWGVVGTYYKPFVAYAKSSFHGNPVPSHPVEGQGVGLLRNWLKRFGFSSITIGPPSL